MKKSGDKMNQKFNININAKVNSSFEGPSKSYYQAKNRFDEILRTKLGVNNSPSTIYRSSPSNVYGMASSVNAIYDDVRRSSGATAVDIDAKLIGTGLEGLGASFVEAERNYNINAWFLAGLAVHESGYGTSKIAVDKNNIFGFQAYDSSPYESARTFTSKEAGVDHVAKYISEAYLTPGGAFYNGVSVDSIGKRYATDPDWAAKVKKHMANLLLA
ncbi:MAG TPA: endo-beta-N-acetylglucosaminidase [Clostridiales bacterium UBA8960]|nr:endo-beta-N-acetylglucosaminidase [Clostridiales bacterium UBA8960]